MSRQIHRTKVRELLKSTRGLMFSVIFVKKDQSIRNMTCRLKVRKGVKGTGPNYAANPKFPYLTVYDMNKHGFRNINLSTLLSCKVNGKIYEIID